MQCHKVLGKENPADLYTKCIDATNNNPHTKKLGYAHMKGNSTEAPQLHMVAQSTDEYKNGDTQELCKWVQVPSKKLINNNQAHGRYTSKRSELNNFTATLPTKRHINKENECCQCREREGHQDIYIYIYICFTWCPHHWVSPARRQADELYRIQMQQLIESLRGTEQLGAAMIRKELSAVKRKPPQTESNTLHNLHATPLR